MRVLLVVVAMVAGCGGDGGGGADATAGADAMGPDAYLPAGNSGIRGRLVDGVQPSIPLEGVAVRIAGTGLVATSDAAGEWQLDGVPAGETVLWFDGADYFPQASRIFTVPDGATYAYEGYGIVGMVSESITFFYADLLDKTLDPAKGHIVANAAQPSGEALVGASLSVNGTTCDAPIYVNEDSAPDPALTATTSRGLVIFYNCDVADAATVHIAHATATQCAGIGEDAPQPITVNLYAARMTYAGTYVCGAP